MIKMCVCISILMSTNLTFAAIGESPKYDFKPVILDSKDSTGSTIGIEYNFKDTLYEKLLNSVDSGPGIDINANAGSVGIYYEAKGIVAASKDRNPKNFLEFNLDAKYLLSTAKIGTIKGGLIAKYETNQSFSSKQTVFGLKGTIGKMDLFQTNAFGAIDGSFGRVDPIDDSERKVALGVSTLDPYNRLNMEIEYIYPLKGNTLKNLEFNYRYFLEVNAPNLIKAANLDKHELATIRLDMKDDLFVAYSVGKLPFDRKNEQLVQIGFSYKLN